jgi:hypothetical protein
VGPTARWSWAVDCEKYDKIALDLLYEELD